MAFIYLLRNISDDVRERVAFVVGIGIRIGWKCSCFEAEHQKKKKKQGMNKFHIESSMSCSVFSRSRMTLNSSISE